MYSTLIAALSIVSAETIVGSYIFQRHGDRLQKPTVYLTPIGTRQCQESGEFYQNRYFSQSNISGLDPVYNASQFSIDTPSSDVLWKSMLAWTHGFYPNLDDDEAPLVQGAQMSNDSVETTLGRVQYVFIDAIDNLSDDYWMVNGGDGCSKVSSAAKAYLTSDEFKALNSSTAEFYNRLEKYTWGDFNSSKLNFANAFTVFDHFLTHDVHNETFHDLIGGQGSDVFKQVRSLQDQYTKGVNVNPAEDVVQLSGATILSQVKAFMQQLQSNKNSKRISVLGGSYDQFYKIFQLLGWFNVDDSRFTGIVNYGTSLVFEVFHEDDATDLQVRVGIRNGTAISEPNVTLDFYPVYGRGGTSVPIGDFLNKVKTFDTPSWCNYCGSEASVCEVSSLESSMKGKHVNELSPAAYGGIGAGVTAATFLVAACIFVGWVLMRRRGKNNASREHSFVESENTVVLASSKV